MALLWFWAPSERDALLGILLGSLTVHSVSHPPVWKSQLVSDIDSNRIPGRAHQRGPLSETTRDLVAVICTLSVGNREGV